MDIKTFILVNKKVIEKLAIKKDEEKVVNYSRLTPYEC